MKEYILQSQRPVSPASVTTIALCTKDFATRSASLPARYFTAGRTQSWPNAQAMSVIWTHGVTDCHSNKSCHSQSSSSCPIFFVIIPPGDLQPKPMRKICDKGLTIASIDPQHIIHAAFLPTLRPIFYFVLCLMMVAKPLAILIEILSLAPLAILNGFAIAAASFASNLPPDIINLNSPMLGKPSGAVANSDTKEDICHGRSD